MAQIAKLRLLLSSAFGPTVAVILLALLVGYVVLGGSGILAWGDYTRQLHDSRAELRVVQQERTRLANRVNLLDPHHVDPDMSDELIRRELNVGHPDEVILPLN
ncbi:MAG: septum formation initiator family protein [Sphingobium sp.]